MINNILPTIALPTTPTLSVAGLQCIRDDRVLFDNLNFSVSGGEVLQIEGRNGSGKTSLLRILCGLALPTEGIVYWQGQDILDLQGDYWENLLYIGHLAGIKVELTPLENLQVTRALASQTTDIDLTDALAIIGLRGFEDVPVRTLSAGQQRRVALARLLVCNVPLWILDEPFTSLDKAAIQMIEGLLDAHAQRGNLVVLTSHHTVNCQQARCLDLND
ncbi:cytochrome c biogenesis heme-transporting ATPase CcmA [Beggiatoa leptomitoformis]|uniref:Cytochrome c biogenesis heme-transporting ATPase CcmA n=1 Tax=Beggiatoa leptomitoformis TaxID=288004 RepID=A0A2N9YB53_9GAMM|nr:cytochrome c biogenesis heme-transporting ATPase CcmA [Beggiatoa leptomitoformis]ALG66951.1 cytochrome c biogenesis heme-transporting ATPase CcmA [Beggiatoa leptomitoformis]AUI67680.1 cytochrome c biogenesis heme-transporting ATPase CcmA [Beggiatoa leptomitoformis]